jgi:hypothetical protein
MDGTGHVVRSHSGAFLLGAATTVTMMPAGDIGITAFISNEPYGLPKAVAAPFDDIIETGDIQNSPPQYQSACSTG